MKNSACFVKLISNFSAGSLLIVAASMVVACGSEQASTISANSSSVVKSQASGELKPLAANCSGKGKYVRDLFEKPEDLDTSWGIAFSSQIDWEKATEIDCAFLMGVVDKRIFFSSPRPLEKNLSVSELKGEGLESWKQHLQDNPAAGTLQGNKLISDGRYSLGFFIKFVEVPQFEMFKMNIGSGSTGALIERLPVLLKEYFVKEKEWVAANCNEQECTSGETPFVGTPGGKDQDEIMPGDSTSAGSQKPSIGNPGSQNAEDSTIASNPSSSSGGAVNNSSNGGLW